MKQFVVVEPTRVINEEGTHSKYSYPNSGNLSKQAITYNRTLPDFLMEQLWLIEGTQQEIDAFVAHASITAVQDWGAADALAHFWNPILEFIADPAAVLSALNELKETITLPASLDSDNPESGINKKAFVLESVVPALSMSAVAEKQ